MIKIQFIPQIYLFLLFMLLSLALKAQKAEVPDTTVFAQMEFTETEYNFGDLYQGEKAEHNFKFKNIGNSPLILNNVLTTCGCTASEWPREPIQPGAKAEIKVVFNSASKIGRQNKVITIRSNAKEGDYRLRISVMVLPSNKEKD